ncbi:WXG100 family type VII secretion target [Amycolatopsis japonica]|uniref:WXG100 family type VII secretion target n=1 Tax=Amycolatopsis japonica TaxID=208439 RepID=UPI00332AA3C3
MSDFGKSDSGMKAGITAITTCESECQKIHQGVAAVRADLMRSWQGAAGDTFRIQLEQWETEYTQVIKMLGEIRDMVTASNTQMNTVEGDLQVTTANAYGGGSGDGIYKQLI